MGTCKTKATQADLGIFRHILAYFAITRDIKELIRHIRTYSEPCVIMVYLEPSHIQYQKHIQNLVKDNN